MRWHLSLGGRAGRAALLRGSRRLLRGSRRCVRASRRVSTLSLSKLLEEVVVHVHSVGPRLRFGNWRFCPGARIPPVFFTPASPASRLSHKIANELIWGDELYESPGSPGVFLPVLPGLCQHGPRSSNAGSFLGPAARGRTILAALSPGHRCHHRASGVRGVRWFLWFVAMCASRGSGVVWRVRSGGRLGWVRRGRPPSRPRGAVGSGAAAVESAADSVVSRSLGCVGGLGWL
jgi:hypothetical protein